MGHRALVAYRRPDRLFDLRYSHWGGANLGLVETLSAETPLARGRVDSGVLADSVAFERILSEFLDPRVHEALYVVSGAFEVTAHRVLWLSWDDGRLAGRGAVVETEPGPADLAVRTWFRATKTALADVVEMGVLSRRAAQSYLEARVCEDQAGTLYTYEAADCDLDGTDPENGPGWDDLAGDGSGANDAFADGRERWVDPRFDRAESDPTSPPGDEDVESADRPGIERGSDQGGDSKQDGRD